MAQGLHLPVNTIIFKHVYWYMQQISGERLQDHWSSGLVHMTKMAAMPIYRKSP